MRDFALPVPSLVIALLLGVPPEDLGLFQHHTTTGLDQRSTDEEKAQAFGAMYAYIEELVERKEREPGDDLISRLVTEYVATGQLDHATTAMTSVIMMQAGHETTANMISLGTVALLEHPDVFERLGQTDDPAVIANIVEELMRYLTIVHSQVDRVATEDLDDRWSADSRRGIRDDEPARRKLGRRIRRQSGSLRRRPKHPRALGLWLRRAPMHRSEPGPRRDAGRVRHAGAAPTRAANWRYRRMS